MGENFDNLSGNLYNTNDAKPWPIKKSDIKEIYFQDSVDQVSDFILSYESRLNGLSDFS